MGNSKNIYLSKVLENFAFIKKKRSNMDSRSETNWYNTEVNNLVYQKSFWSLLSLYSLLSNERTIVRICKEIGLAGLHLRNIELDTRGLRFTETNY